MKPRSNIILSTSPKTQLARKFRGIASLALHQRRLYGKPRRNNTGKESDSETGLYYFGARYLDPKTGRWLSGDPAVGEYIPSAPVNDEARKRNGNLPGMGGVFNYVNLHVYHYAGNNPVKYVDPDGRFIPDSDGNLIAEAGDNFGTLVDFLRISTTDASNLLSAQGYTRGFREGDKIKLNNVYTRSIANANISDDYQGYNCWSAAIAGTSGQEINSGIEEIDPGSEFENRLKLNYTPVSESDAVFGRTVLRFQNTRGSAVYWHDNSTETTHGAVFYGRSRDGTIYVYTKNGHINPPVVMRLADLLSQFPDYGSVGGYSNRR